MNCIQNIILISTFVFWSITSFGQAKRDINIDNSKIGEFEIVLVHEIDKVEKIYPNDNSVLQFDPIKDNKVFVRFQNLKWLESDYKGQQMKIKGSLIKIESDAGAKRKSKNSMSLKAVSYTHLTLPTTPYV